MKFPPVSGSKKGGKAYRGLLSYLRPYWRWFAVAVGAMIITGGLNSLTAYLFKPIIDGVFVEKNLGFLNFLAVVVVVIFAAKGVFFYIQFYLMGRIGQRVIMDIRNDLYSRMIFQPMSFFAQHSTGSLISRVTYDISLIEAAVTRSVSNLIKDFFTVIGLAVVVFVMSWRLAFLGLIVFPLAVYPLLQFGLKLRRISVKSQEHIGTLSDRLNQAFSGIEVVKTFRAEEQEKERFHRHNKDLYNVLMKAYRVRGLSTPVVEMVGGIAVAAVMWVGGYWVIKGIMTLGQFSAFTAALMMLYEPIKRLNQTNHNLQQGVAAAIRVYDILQLPTEASVDKGTREVTEVKKGLEFKNVSFHYGEEEVLRDISFTAPVGTVTAIVGYSGVGKTTLVSLIPRLYPLIEGAILLDGIDTREITLGSLRSLIGVVSQETFLFNDSVSANIAYGKPTASQEEIEAAARVANAHEFILAMADGYDSLIGERGQLLSGGQRQRISIARAVLKDPPILILDEATSSLDSESERIVQEALGRLMKNRTVFVIAHRLSTVIEADQIVVLSEGRVEGLGTHHDLIKVGGTYQELYEQQFFQPRVGQSLDGA